VSQHKRAPAEADALLNSHHDGADLIEHAQGFRWSSEDMHGLASFDSCQCSTKQVK
jgi:hypothetical protein